MVGGVTVGRQYHRYFSYPQAPHFRSPNPYILGGEDGDDAVLDIQDGATVENFEDHLRQWIPSLRLLSIRSGLANGHSQLMWTLGQLRTTILAGGGQHVMNLFVCCHAICDYHGWIAEFRRGMDADDIPNGYSKFVGTPINFASDVNSLRLRDGWECLDREDWLRFERDYADYGLGVYHDPAADRNRIIFYHQRGVERVWDNLRLMNPQDQVFDLWPQLRGALNDGIGPIFLVAIATEAVQAHDVVRMSIIHGLFGDARPKDTLESIQMAFDT
jgi:hypothetical protein